MTCIVDNSCMDYQRLLRIALRTNAVSSAGFGLAGLIFADRVVEFLGAGNALLVRLVAAGLVAFAAFVAFASMQAIDRVKDESLWISIGDLGWVAASVVIISLGLLTTPGAIAAGLVAALVLDFALAQLYTRAKLGSVPNAELSMST